MNAIPAIEEVNIFKDDVVIQFIIPKGRSYADSFAFYLERCDFVINDFSLLFRQFKPLLQQIHGLSVGLLQHRVCIYSHLFPSFILLFSSNFGCGEWNWHVTVKELNRQETE